ncbi:DUF4249 domain-containing protein [Roseivirga misakiensis]|uniref:DUF4249 domain-containing protein n=1 Tax=Roseivirga misakiensis TaxID=1563681 RepID=A0A1E5T077_9BACT|nr:DUF4249 domain-containing protein [Roseivirga misakiensis]OEK04788.1 hypothetical protein BFP71_15190 [Roseivirga misakiensis]
MQFKRTYISLLAFVALLVFGCEETVQLDLGQLEERVVIEGLVTNEQDGHYVKLTRTRDFYTNGPAERIEDATVSVSDENGNTYSFVHNPNGLPEEEGFYYPITPFQGQIGTTYSLSVAVDGEQYTAAEELLPVTAIDSLTVTIDFEELEEPEEEGRYYEVLFYASEPQDRKDQYLFKFYNDGEIVKDFPTDIYFSDDDLLGERIDDLEIAGFYKLGEMVEVEMYSLTQEAFIFYSDLFNLLNNDGGMFSPPPADPRNNLSNGALGYFQVSAVSREQILIEDPRDD